MDCTVIALLWLFLLGYFKPDLLTSVTVISGGDTISHYYPAKYMHDYLLPNIKLTGWSMGWYAGFPMFQYYFPFLFAVAAAAGYVIPLQISVKLATVLGTLLLPLFTLISMKLMGFKFPAPAFAAMLSMPFLFIETNSMWGGNLPSTLAGEFSYSFSLAVTVLFFGALYNGIKTGRWLAKNAAMFALVAITHVYTMLWALASSAHLLMKDKKNLPYLALVFSCGLLLVSFWLIPLLASMGYTTGYADRWTIDRLDMLFPPIILPFVLAGIFGISVSGKKNDDGVVFLFFTVMAAAALFIAAPYLGFVDIRFIPFIQFALTIMAAYPLAEAARKFRHSWMTPMIGLAIIFLWVNNNVNYIPGWIDWNYSGVENKASAKEYFGINNFLNGTISDPRVVFEHSSSYESMGGIRAFESLPLFSGRPTTEGLYMQSSPSSPFVFYAQSEYSDQVSCPFPNFRCTSLNLTVARKHLEIFNVRHLIAASARVKSELSNSSLFNRVYTTGKYEVYELNGSDTGYVKVPEYRPVFFAGGDRVKTSYEWFKNYSLLDVPIVFENVDGLTANDLNALPRERIDTECNIEENISNEGVEFSTDCAGLPHIIKISYHPYWSVTGADKIYPVSPSFMLVYPNSGKVAMKYGISPVFTAAYLLSVLGMLMLLALSKITNASSLTKR